MKSQYFCRRTLIITLQESWQRTHKSDRLLARCAAVVGPLLILQRPAPALAAPIWPDFSWIERPKHNLQTTVIHSQVNSQEPTRRANHSYGTTVLPRHLRVQFVGADFCVKYGIWSECPASILSCFHGGQRRCSGQRRRFADFAPCQRVSEDPTSSVPLHLAHDIEGF
jgi:hypothetical protein